MFLPVTSGDVNSLRVLTPHTTLILAALVHPENEVRAAGRSDILPGDEGKVLVLIQISL